jgi:hypothetical protein
VPSYLISRPTNITSNIILILCWKVSDLTKSIQNLYRDKISQDEAEIAKGNLVGFFKVLQGIEERQQKQKVDITQNVKIKVIKTYENHGNSN